MNFGKTGLALSLAPWAVLILMALLMALGAPGFG